MIEVGEACLRIDGRFCNQIAHGHESLISRISPFYDKGRQAFARLNLPFEQVQPYYDALFLFRRILEDECNHYRIRLEAGDLVMFDNERILHGRVGHSIGERHLQGCYADRDGLLSTLRVLERDHE